MRLKTLLSVFRRVDSEVLGRLVIWLFTRKRFQPLSLASKRIVDAAQPKNPLGRASLPSPIEVLWVAARKDFGALEISIQSLRHVRNEIRDRTIVVPSKDYRLATSLFRGVSVLDESTFLPKKLRDAVETHHPGGRRGWILQQVLGLEYIRNSRRPGVLWIDADTVLTKSRVFLARDGRQLLSISTEFNQDYEDHARKIWPYSPKLPGISFVTHHQLMQPRLVREMFPTLGALISWVEAGSLDSQSPISEFHSYGRFITSNYLSKVAFARWGNKPEYRKNIAAIAEDLDSRLPANDDLYSVSFHSWLEG